MCTERLAATAVDHHTEREWMGITNIPTVKCMNELEVTLNNRFLITLAVTAGLTREGAEPGGQGQYHEKGAKPWGQGQYHERRGGAWRAMAVP